MATPIPDTEWDRGAMLAFEREMLGLYVSGHPLDHAEATLRANRRQEIAEVLGEDSEDRAPVVLPGLIAGVVRKVTKKGDTWAIVTLEDLTGSVEVLFFSQKYQSVAHLLVPDSIVKVTGNVNVRDGAVSVYGDTITALQVAAVAPEPVTLSAPLRWVNEDSVDRLKRVLADHPGTSPVQMRLDRPSGGNLLLSLNAAQVSDTPAFRSEINALLGPAVPRTTGTPK
jgi:DNA polymerase-3 subunit alpha